VDVAIMAPSALTGYPQPPLLLAGSDATSVAEEFAAVGNAGQGDGGTASGLSPAGRYGERTSSPGWSHSGQ